MNRAPVALGIAAVAAITGYALTGRPRLPDTPAPPRIAEAPTSQPAIKAATDRLLQHQGDVGAWLLLSDALARQGATQESVAAMQVAINAFPRSPDLWVGLGNALILHANGQVTPAARLAFARANRLDPTQPAPRFFLGLAYLQSGDSAQALEIWQGLRASSPAGAPWLPDLEARIAELQPTRAR
jgi:cytochrome c-type biogenesis protein CcmH